MKEPMTNDRIKYLEAAPKMIVSGEHEFICRALFCANEKFQNWRLHDDLVKEIENYIYPYNTVNSWVFYNVFGGRFGESPSRSDLKDFRIRWLKHLIEQEKNKLVVDKS